MTVEGSIPKLLANPDWISPYFYQIIHHQRSVLYELIFIHIAQSNFEIRSGLECARARSSRVQVKVILQNSSMIQEALDNLVSMYACQLVSTLVHLPSMVLLYYLHV